MPFRDERNGISRRPTRNFSMAYMAFFLGLLEKGVCLWIIIHVVYGYAFLWTIHRKYSNFCSRPNPE